MIGNALLCKENGVVKYIGKFPGEEYVYLPLFSEIVRYNNELYFIPCGAKAIAVYNLADGSFRRMLFPHKSKSEFYSLKALKWEENIYLFPSIGEGIYKISLVDNSIEVYSEWKADIPEEAVASNGWLSAACVVQNNLAFFAFLTCKKIMRYNLENDSYQIWSIGEGLGYSTIAFDGDKFWLSPRGEGSIVAWKPEQGILAEYNEYPVNFRGGSYSSSFVWDKYCWIFPNGANKVLKINTSTGEISEDNLLAAFCEKEDSKYAIWHTPFTFCNYMGGKVILSTGKTAEGVIYHLADQRLERFYIEPPENWQFDYAAALEQNYQKRCDDLKKRKREWKKKQKFHQETSEYRIKEFIEDVEREKAEDVLDDKIGNDIWQKLFKG